MYVYLINGDPFANNFRVTDSNTGGTLIFNGTIAANSEQVVQCMENGAGYGNIITYQDNNAGIGRSFLHDGDRVNV